MFPKASGGSGLTKRTIAAEISAHVPGLSEPAAARIVDIVIGEIVAELRRTGDVTVPALGRFRIKKRAARKGINPKTREPIAIPAKTVVAFKPTSWFENRVFDAS